jgi:hypothetical protein
MCAAQLSLFGVMFSTAMFIFQRKYRKNYRYESGQGAQRDHTATVLLSASLDETAK